MLQLVSCINICVSIFNINILVNLIEECNNYRWFCLNAESACQDETIDEAMWFHACLCV